MKWRDKARIQNAIASLPFGTTSVYYAVQRLFGGLRRGFNNPIDRFSAAVRIVDAIEHAGGSIRGKCVLEVGTGHMVNLPTALWLMGAAETVTVDLNKYLSGTLVDEAMQYVRENVAAVSGVFGAHAHDADFQRRLEQLIKFSGDLQGLLDMMNVRYLCPCDVTALPVPENSFDFHVSNTVLEHIPPSTLEEMLRESKRVLARDGMHAHIIDLSDHFSHNDSTISSANFLKFSDDEWNRLAGNRFMYQNRLRAPEYLAIFEKAGVRVLLAEPLVDQNAANVLDNEFPLDQKFSRFNKEELVIRELLVVGVFGDGGAAPK